MSEKFLRAPQQARECSFALSCERGKGNSCKQIECGRGVERRVAKETAGKITNTGKKAPKAKLLFFRLKLAIPLKGKAALKKP